MEERNSQNTEDNSEFYDIEDQIEETEATSSKTTVDEKNETETVRIEENIEILQKKLEEQQKLSQRHKDQYLRALADYENLEKRTIAERSRLHKNATENFIIKLLDFADSLEKAKPNFLDSSNSQSILKDGFLAIEKQFFTILEKEGVKKLDSIGKKFDPNFHEVVSVRTDSDKDEDEILEEVQTGYTMNSSLLRPSKVIIAKK